MTWPGWNRKAGALLDRQRSLTSSETQSCRSQDFQTAPNGEHPMHIGSNPNLRPHPSLQSPHQADDPKAKPLTKHARQTSLPSGRTHRMKRYHWFARQLHLNPRHGPSQQDGWQSACQPKGQWGQKSCKGAGWPIQPIPDRPQNLLKKQFFLVALWDLRQLRQIHAHPPSCHRDCWSCASGHDSCLVSNDKRSTHILDLRSHLRYSWRQGWNEQVAWNDMKQSKRMIKLENAASKCYRSASMKASPCSWMLLFHLSIEPGYGTGWPMRSRRISCLKGSKNVGKFGNFLLRMKCDRENQCQRNSIANTRNTPKKLTPKTNITTLLSWLNMW